MNDYNAFAVVLLVVAVFLGIRQFWWWYWGLNRIVAALEDIALSLRTLPTVERYDRTNYRKPPRAA
ncbi:MAG TPA: hypothetical protein VGH29_00940 [Candidatus Binataceae bacterium]|jgi:hypothetical protein